MNKLDVFWIVRYKGKDEMAITIYMYYTTRLSLRQGCHLSTMKYHIYIS